MEYMCIYSAAQMTLHKDWEQKLHFSFFIFLFSYKHQNTKQLLKKKQAIERGMTIKMVLQILT